MIRRSLLAIVVLAASVVPFALSQGKKDADGGVEVDKAKRTVRIDAKVAPRKLPHLKEVYPIEVIACWPHPKGKKAHETVVTIEAKPSAVHKALEGFGLKAGKPVMGGGKTAPQGPEVTIFLEVPGPGGTPKRISLDKTLVDTKSGKPFPKTVRWRFTGSAVVQPDPEKDDTVYGADLSGTLITIFPVTDQTVFQSGYSFDDQRLLRLETNQEVLPKEGTPVKLVIQVPKGGL